MLSHGSNLLTKEKGSQVKKMKTIKKAAIIMALVVSLAVVCSTVYATFYVTSAATPATTVSYSVTISEVRGFNPTFSLTAKVVDASSDGASCVTNVPVTFYVSVDGGSSWTAIGTAHTNSAGIATSSYSIQSNDETDQFQAAIGIP